MTRSLFLLLAVVLLFPKWSQADSMESLVAETAARFEKELKAADAVAWFDRYQAYSAKLLDNSAGTNSYRDKTGNCRLAWFDRLMRDSRKASYEAERFSSSLQETSAARRAVFSGLMRQGLDKIEASAVERKSPDSGLSALTHAVALLRQDRDRMFDGMPAIERVAFLFLLESQALGSNYSGHSFASSKLGRLACDGLEKIDRKALASAGLTAARLADQWREGVLDKEPGSWASPVTAAVAGVEGALVGVWPVEGGVLVVGGEGSNTYRLDENLAIVAVMDLGGNDRYVEGSVWEKRPVLVLIDRSGDDVYAGRKAGLQGGACGGVSILLDAGGNDRYEALDLAQGAVLAGIGLLADAGGDDVYFADRRVQGSAVGGVGILWDGGGNDHYQGALWAQGVGGPLGFGLLADLAGNDAYYAGGKYLDGYDDSPGYEGWSQGVGAGPRGSGNGGVGVLLDGAGDDQYEYDYFSHGGGYWFAVGIARDFGGNDRRIGATRVGWDGKPRTEKPFVRYGPAFGCHFAMGFLFDDAGDDLYTGTAAGNGFSWDIALGGLFDAGGNDRYTGGNGGYASQTSFSILADGGGNDAYEMGKPGTATAISEYHAAVSNCSNFAFTFDRGGDDQWKCGLSNGQQRAQGWAGGILIDR